MFVSRHVSTNTKTCLPILYRFSRRRIYLYLWDEKNPTRGARWPNAERVGEDDSDDESEDGSVDGESDCELEEDSDENETGDVGEGEEDEQIDHEEEGFEESEDGDDEESEESYDEEGDVDESRGRKTSFADSQVRFICLVNSKF